MLSSNKRDWRSQNINLWQQKSDLAVKSSQRADSQKILDGSAPVNKYENYSQTNNHLLVYYIRLVIPKEDDRRFSRE